MNEWVNQIKDIKPYIGFVYEVIELDTGKIYIGIKRYWKSLKLKPLKGKKRKRKQIKESDWRTYNSSNKEIQEKIKKNPDNYHKLIIRNCESITELKAYEAFYQLEYYVNGKWEELYNECVNLRLRIRK